MKIVTYNINGIRASMKLHLDEWISNYDADIYCFQEVRATEKVAKELLLKETQQLDLFSDIKTDNNLKNYNIICNCGNIPGYAGTLTISKFKPDKIDFDMGQYWTDNEGRTTTIYIGKLAIINAYIPNGNSRLEFKMKYLDALNRYITYLKNTYSVICVGDYNIAHNEIDLSHPKECKNKSVFLPIERKSFQALLNLGLIDSYRYLNPELVKYSWRSYRSRNDNSYNSWKYRIDYILVSNDLKKNIIKSDILDLPYSDHQPCIIEIDWSNKK